jgi:hypothetical protein
MELTRRSALVALTGALTRAQPREFTFHIVNDSCNDITWGFDVETTKSAFVELLREYLDEIARTAEEPAWLRSRYTMNVAIQAEWFVERYPERKDELARRIKEGSLCLSPFYVNTLWGMQSNEGFLRSLYAARRMEREWGVRIDVAEHIELPSLPWGAATLLAGAGIRWLSVPFLDYDCTFKSLTNRPLFELEGPDGSRVRVVMDPWASGKWGYVQGKPLAESREIRAEWSQHYSSLGGDYPLDAVLASGTHSDLMPGSARQVRSFTQLVKDARKGATVVNSTLREFCDAVDSAEKSKGFLRPLRGTFGDSWEFWPVTLAAYAAAWRIGERQFLAAETMFALCPETAKAPLGELQRTERRVVLLSDHAWNGTDQANRRVNASLRRDWSEDLTRMAGQLTADAWAALGLKPAESCTVLNTQSMAREDVVRLECDATIVDGLPSQSVEEDERRVLYFAAPRIDGFSAQVFPLRSTAPASKPQLKEMGVVESRFYRLKIDPKRGAISTLMHRPGSREIFSSSGGALLGETVFFDGQDHRMTATSIEATDDGPVLKRIRVRGVVAGISCENWITLHEQLDRIDFEFIITKPITTREQRLCHLFPLATTGMVQHVQSCGAILRLDRDYLPGADRNRVAVQDFVDVSAPGGPGVTIAPREAFAWRRDLDGIAFEAIGNDQNYREVIHDQNGVTRFRFRYSLRAHGGFDAAAVLAWAQGVANPLQAALGEVPPLPRKFTVDASRAIATCLKPSDDPSRPGVVLRIWECAGKNGPVSVRATGTREARLVDLLERDGKHLAIREGVVEVPIRPHGFAAVRFSEL